MKNTLKTAAILALVWLWLPTGASDILIIPFIISRIGFEMYVILSIVFVILIYRWIEGKTLQDKFKTIKMEMKSLVR